MPNMSVLPSKYQKNMAEVDVLWQTDEQTWKNGEQNFEKLGNET